jgi:hypothetical protein
MEFMDKVIAGIEKRDHKSFPVNAENTHAVFDEMEAAGYVFACARAANEEGFRTVYFVPDPDPMPRFSI